MVSALSIENKFTLAEVKTHKKSNEVKAIPLLLAMLELEGVTVSVDAIGCNNTVIDAILKEGASYVIGLKKISHLSLKKWSLTRLMKECD